MPLALLALLRWLCLNRQYQLFLLGSSLITYCIKTGFKYKKSTVLLLSWALFFYIDSAQATSSKCMESWKEQEDIKKIFQDEKIKFRESFPTAVVVYIEFIAHNENKPLGQFSHIDGKYIPYRVGSGILWRKQYCGCTDSASFSYLEDALSMLCARGS